MNVEAVAVSHNSWVAGCQTLMQRWILRFQLPQSDADDVIQEVWAELLARQPEGPGTEGPVRFGAWLRRVLFTKAMDLFRDKARRRALSLEEILGTVREPLSRNEDPGCEFEAHERRERVEAAVRGLAAGKHALNARLLVGRYRDGRTVAAIAAATGLTEKQVRDRLAWTLARLRKTLKVMARPRRLCPQAPRGRPGGPQDAEGDGPSAAQAECLRRLPAGGVAEAE